MHLSSESANLCTTETQRSKDLKHFSSATRPIPDGGKRSLFSVDSRPDVGIVLPPIHRVQCGGSLVATPPVREARHSPVSSGEVQNEWCYSSSHPYSFMSWCFIKHMDSFKFHFSDQDNKFVGEHCLYFSVAATIFGPSGSSSDCYTKMYTKILSCFKVSLSV